MTPTPLGQAELAIALTALSYALAVGSLLCACSVPLSRRGVVPADLSLLLGAMTFVCAVAAGANIAILRGLWELFPSFAAAVGWASGFAVSSALILLLGEVDYEQLNTTRNVHRQSNPARSEGEAI